ncbi:hypothetical protein KIF59_05355 [Enterobacter cloacae subsp. cloacae]|nr:hypothetical protein [Enterobacter cloacae subsp. cloacae]
MPVTSVCSSGNMELGLYSAFVTLYITGFKSTFLCASFNTTPLESGFTPSGKFR